MKTFFYLLVYFFGLYINAFMISESLSGMIVNPFYTIPLILTILLLKKIRLKLVKATVIAWLIYLIFGIIYTTQSCLAENFWRLNVSNSVLIYGVYLLAFTVSSILFENFLPIVHESKRYNSQNRIPTIYIFFLLAFPIIWLSSLLVTIGYVPLFSGNSFYDDVYNTNYGPLYGYVAYISVSVIIAFYLLDQSNNKIRKIIIALVILIFLIISIADGKRYTILTSFISLAVYYIYCLRKTVPKVTAIIVGIFMVLVYSGMHLIRTASLDSNKLVGSIIEVPIGVEFRDFVYTENNFQPQSIKGYDYTSSTLASFFNDGLLNLFRFNKSQLTTQGSAYAWKRIYFDLFRTDFGIRTGIVSELYFAYSYFGIIVFSIFSLFLVRISHSIQYRGSNLQNIIYCVMYALFVMIIVGQTTAFVGQIMLLVYLISSYKLMYHKKIHKIKVVENHELSINA